ncbi:uncharacterized protein EV420DRAFT_1641606 [Desarmillaria tabescens]|uniref:Uncharacterized protein n=1 Tax=Armillaria tabescens TaxID=1929756 RepID=A0AA39N7E1_ARMTA|nr:uncharacterized protein EV420DRAFT_1641606 [Desarmillaria tabescens]KAK0460265.1 hypothetical protein EV420DRAFT_1641606 [Desarmillaria tabescens]
MEGRAPDLSQDDINIIIGTLDLNLNTTILQALLHGLYTGIVAVTLWTMFSSPKRLHGIFLRTVIIILNVLATITFAMGWAFIRHAFIAYGDNYIKVFGAIAEDGLWWRLRYFVYGINGGVSTLLVDTTIIWRCWVLWDRQWRIVSLPIVCTVAGTVMKVMQILSDLPNSPNGFSEAGGFSAKIDWSLSYILLTLATTLTCTLLIVYRVVRQASRMSASRKIVKMLIESSAIYSLSLIVY